MDGFVERLAQGAPFDDRSELFLDLVLRKMMAIADKVPEGMTGT